MFKKQMLEVKKGVKDEGKGEGEKMEMADDGLSYRKLMQEDFENPNSGWSKTCQFDKGNFGG